MFTMLSPNGTFDRTFLMNYANIYIVDNLKRIKGVGDISTFGSTYSMRIWLNPDKLSELGLTISDVKNAIREQNVQAPSASCLRRKTRRSSIQAVWKASWSRRSNLPTSS